MINDHWTLIIDHSDEDIIMSWITSPEAWLGLLTLTVLEIVLGIDNIIFLSIVSARLPLAQQAMARRIGLGLALLQGIQGLVQAAQTLLQGVPDVAELGQGLVHGGAFLEGRQPRHLGFQPLLQALLACLVTATGRRQRLETLVEDGESGLLVPPGDRAALAEAMERVLMDHRLRMHLAHGSRDRAEHFTWHRVGDGIEDVYRRVLAEHAHRVAV